MLMKNALELTVWSKENEAESLLFNVKRVCCSRNADRDIEKTKKSLDKIREKGFLVHPNPGICRRSRYLVTTEETIEVQGSHTSGEVEFVAIFDQEDVLITVGSDHNDRSLVEITTPLGKIHDSAKSKQMVSAVVAAQTWKYEDIKGHWDDLILRSYVNVSGERTAYQDYCLRELLDLDYYFDKHAWLNQDGTIFFGGTSGTLPSVPDNIFTLEAPVNKMKELIFPNNFEFQIHDPILDRTISHSYSIRSLEEAGSLSL
jgi:hypothetical protein